MYISFLIHEYPVFLVLLFSLIPDHILFCIHVYLTIYPFLSSFLILLHLWISYPFVSIDIRIFLLLDIRCGSRLVRLVAAFSLIGPALACPAHQRGKPLFFFRPQVRRSPAPWPTARRRRRLRPAARRSSSAVSRRVRRRRRISAGQQRRRLRPATRRRAVPAVAPVPVVCCAGVGYRRGSSGTGSGPGLAAAPAPVACALAPDIDGVGGDLCASNKSRIRCTQISSSVLKASMKSLRPP
jgi:hypothetical protein